MDKLLIGIIVKPQGIKGEVKVKLFTDGFESVSGLNEIFIDDVAYPVLKMRCDKDVFMLLRGIADRNAAELLRQKQVYADKDAVKRPKGRYFICDVLGCFIAFEDGEVFGKVTDILSGRTDIYYVETKNGKAIFPLIKSLGARFDIPARTITVNKQEFLNEVCYED